MWTIAIILDGNNALESVITFSGSHQSDGSFLNDAKNKLDLLLSLRSKEYEPPISNGDINERTP